MLQALFHNSHLKEGDRQGFSMNNAPICKGNVLICPPGDESDGFHWNHTAGRQKTKFLLWRQRKRGGIWNLHDDNDPNKRQLPVVNSKVIDNDTEVLHRVVRNNQGAIAQSRDHKCETPHKILGEKWKRVSIKSTRPLEGVDLRPTWFDRILMLIAEGAPTRKVITNDPIVAQSRFAIKKKEFCPSKATILLTYHQSLEWFLLWARCRRSLNWYRQMTSRERTIHRGSAP